jgi:hypothetical protein
MKKIIIIFAFLLQGCASQYYESINNISALVLAEGGPAKTNADITSFIFSVPLDPALYKS